MVGGHLGVGFDEGRGTDNAVFADSRPVDNHRAHAHQRVAANYAAVQNSAVADMALLFHHRILAWEAVHYAVVLYIGPVFDHDAAKIAAQAGVGPNIDPFAEDHVANQHRGRVDVTLLRHHRGQSINLINRHATSLCARQTAKALIIERARRGKLADRAFTFLADERQRAGTHPLVNIDT